MQAVALTCNVSRVEHGLTVRCDREAADVGVRGVQLLVQSCGLSASEWHAPEFLRLTGWAVALCDKYCSLRRVADLRPDSRRRLLHAAVVAHRSRQAHDGGCTGRLREAQQGTHANKGLEQAKSQGLAHEAFLVVSVCA